MNINIDLKVIESYGGTAALARKLGLDTPAGVSRVSNWRRRGIPVKVKLENPWIARRAKKFESQVE